MMKHNSRSFVVSGLLMLCLLHPQVVSAQTQDFCANLDATDARITRSLALWQVGAASTTSAWSEVVSEHFSTDETRLAAARESWDTQETQLFDTLATRATTTEKQAALEIFKTTIRDAVHSRRVANDEALSDFRNNMGNELVMRTDMLNDALGELSASIQRARTEAESACGGSDTKALAHDDYIHALTDAKNVFADKITSIQGTNDVLRNIITARNISIQQSTDVFVATIIQALVDLRSAFPDA